MSDYAARPKRKRALAACAAVVATMMALVPSSARGASGWGSPAYGDPPGWCTNFSDMWVATVVTNDPLVGTNPEQDTFYGFHPNPGYDDWYGYFYGDFRGTPNDSSGWVKLLHESYPAHYHWNFADFGWAVHGHAKQYIAYYNWTFGGQCGLGRRGRPSPPPFMADQFGYPVVDIYVDSVPPYPPRPYVSAVTQGSVSFTWAPVADRGDGAGSDYYAAGTDHYLSWLTVSDRPGVIDFATTRMPRVVQLAGMRGGETACVHVEAVDALQNATGDQSVCASPLVPPLMPAWAPPPTRVLADPSPVGLVGLDSWFWLSPAPSAQAVYETYGGVHYSLVAQPVGVTWDFGDGASARYVGSAGFGSPYPDPSTVAHLYQADSLTGYTVGADVMYNVSWTAVEAGLSSGPYPLGTVTIPVRPLAYPVQQAQPDLVSV